MSIDTNPCIGIQTYRLSCAESYNIVRSKDNPSLYEVLYEVENKLTEPSTAPSDVITAGKEGTAYSTKIIEPRLFSLDVFHEKNRFNIDGQEHLTDKRAIFWGFSTPGDEGSAKEADFQIFYDSSKINQKDLEDFGKEKGSFERVSYFTVNGEKSSKKTSYDYPDGYHQLYVAKDIEENDDTGEILITNERQIHAYPEHKKYDLTLCFANQYLITFMNHTQTQNSNEPPFANMLLTRR